MDLGVSGLASNFDWKSLVEQLTEVERAPERRLRSEQNLLEQRNNAYGSIYTQLSVLKSRVDALKDPALFNSHMATVGDSSIASASASTSAAAGVYTFDITQLATASAQQGTSNAGAALNASNDVSSLVLSNAAFGTTVTAGTFTINGKQVTLATTDTLQGVFDKISTATSGAVTGTYDSATDKITLSSASAIVLGSAADTSNFLQVAKLNNNGTGTVASAYALGVVKQSSALSSANLATTISDGGSGAGKFKINGVTINFNASTDTMADVLQRINNSGAGVTASYDVLNDRFTLTNQATGDLGLGWEDVTGNFLAATKLSSGSLTRGDNLLYTVNGGSPLVSQSNTITEASSTIVGLSVTALTEGSTMVSVTSDNAKIKTAITDFIAEYNRAQSLIDSHTVSTTDAQFKVTVGVLAGQTEANEMAEKLRSLANSYLSDLSGSIKHLDGLGIVANGNDNTLTLSDSSKLESALSSNLSAVKDLFTNSSTGLAVQLSSYLDKTAGTEGSLATTQTNLGKQITNIDTQIAAMERVILANQDRLTASFVAMETARATINQQLQFLAQRFGTQG